jgi:hypothetical protein
MAMEFNFSFDFASARRRLEDIQSAMESATRPAAHQGALVLYNEVRARVAALPESVTGNLLKSIYRQFAEGESFPAVSKSPRYPRATYVVSWNWRDAPHGWLVENGHIQWYVVRKGSKGWFTVKRPGVEGPPPPRDASKAVKDAYWLPWENGPRWVEPSPFLRPAWDAKKHQALMAAQATFFKRVMEMLQ